MAIAISDTSGPFLDPIFPMPNLRKSTLIKQSFLHRLGLRKWLAKETRSSKEGPPPTPAPPTPVPLPLLAAAPPPIEHSPPTQRPNSEGAGVGQNSDQKLGTSLAAKRRSANTIDLVGLDRDRADKSGYSPSKRLSANTIDIASICHDVKSDPLPPDRRESVDRAPIEPEQIEPSKPDSTVPLKRQSTNTINLRASRETVRDEGRELLTPNAKDDRTHRRALSADFRRTPSFRRSRSIRASSVRGPSAHRSSFNQPSIPDFVLDSLPPIPHQDSANDLFLPPHILRGVTYSETEYGGDCLDPELERDLDKKWILNLSMRFRDSTDREKFFVTYAESPNHWRRVTVTCDYSNADPDSIEQDLKELQFHRDKNAKIYEAIREALDEVEFYDTVTNLRLETLDGRLHVHVTEDIGEIIPYPSISSITHLGPPLIPESHIAFHRHLSGFVYQVKLNGENYVKKEITGPDTVEEFLYEINALHALLDSDCVINFKGILVDDSMTVVKGLLLDFASKGSLADLFFDYKGKIEWARRERWARQIIKGLGDIHEAGFVQGDFTVSNVVIDENDDAKIIDINRRGCPIGWEPPEFIKKIESKQRISMYIGVKSDLFQLGMTLWAIAMEEEDPGTQPRPLFIPSDSKVPEYFRNIVQICLSPRPQSRLSAKNLLKLFPEDLLIGVTNKHLERPEHDSGNFFTSRKLNTAEPDSSHHHQSDFWEASANNVRINSLPDSSPSSVHEIDDDAELPASTNNLDFTPNSYTDSLGEELQDEPHFSLPTHKPYNPEEEDVPPEFMRIHLVFKELVRCGLDTGASGSSLSRPLALPSETISPTSDSPLTPGPQSGYIQTHVSGTDIPDVLTGIGDHTFPHLTSGQANIHEKLSGTDLLSELSATEPISNDEQSITNYGTSDTDVCCQTTARASNEPNTDYLHFSRLPLNPARVDCSTVKTDDSLSAQISLTNNSQTSSIPFDATSLLSSALSTSDFVAAISDNHLSLNLDRHCSDDNDHDSLFMSQLPINPALTLTQQDPYDPLSNVFSSPCIKLENDSNSSGLRPADDLFTSNLPLNPAHSSEQT